MTANPPSDNCGSFGLDTPGVWYTLTGNGNTMAASTNNLGTDFDTQLRVFEGQDSGALSCVGFNDDAFSGTTTSTFYWCSKPGQKYYIYVHGRVPSVPAGNYELTVIDTPDGCAFGSCCLDHQVCVSVTETECATLSGVYGGDGSTCGVYQYRSTTPFNIPDNSSAGIDDTITVTASEPITSIEIRLDLEHTYAGDVRVTLSRNGTETATLIGLPGRPGGGVSGTSCGAYKHAGHGRSCSATCCRIASTRPRIKSIASSGFIAVRSADEIGSPYIPPSRPVNFGLLWPRGQTS